MELDCSEASWLPVGNGLQGPGREEAGVASWCRWWSVRVARGRWEEANGLELGLKGAIDRT